MELVAVRRGRDVENWKKSDLEEAMDDLAFSCGFDDLDGYCRLLDQDPKVVAHRLRSKIKEEA